jgi:acyl-CoA thioester hydrolase
MLSFITEIRVRFSETDKMQFLHNARYIEYFEIARTEMLRHYGLPYKTIEDNGFEMPVAETFVKYKAPAYYDEVLLIESYVTEYLSPRVKINYRIVRKDGGQLIAEGYTTLAFINKETKKISRPPDFYLKKMQKLFGETHAE